MCFYLGCLLVTLLLFTDFEWRLLWLLWPFRFRRSEFFIYINVFSRFLWICWPFLPKILSPNDESSTRSLSIFEWIGGFKDYSDNFSDLGSRIADSLIHDSIFCFTFFARSYLLIVFEQNLTNESHRNMDALKRLRLER
jgi:hypothetical protein